MDLEDRLLIDADVDASKFLEEDGAGLMTLGRRPPVRKGCRRAIAGFIRRSGSQIKHLAIKSTKNSSSDRNTC